MVAPASRKRSPTRRPQVIDLFSGAGGLSLGFEQAGFDVCAAVELDPVHAATHLFNFPKCVVLPMSVTDVRGDMLRKVAKLDSRRPVVVIGGPPCQGFSMIGQRVLSDPRNRLVREYLRIVVELDAEYFVFENVKGLTVGEHRKLLEELVAEFHAAGYEVRVPWRVLNAIDYGVPQNRQRLILLGAKRGCAIPEYPLPSTSPRRSGASRLALPPTPTCLDALGDLPDADLFDALNTEDTVGVKRWRQVSDYVQGLRPCHKKDWFFGYPRDWDPNILTSSTRTDHTDVSRKRFVDTVPGETEPVSRFFKLPQDGQSNTLRAGTDSSRGAFTSPRPIHYKHPRCITVREMARLHGYPDWFRFHVTKWHGARQVGNSVPPPLARAIAAEVGRALQYTPVYLDRALELGDPSLLSFTVSQAAEFFRIDNPIGVRDRSSGKHKRSQVEVESARRREGK